MAGDDIHKLVLQGVNLTEVPFQIPNIPLSVDNNYHRSEMEIISLLGGGYRLAISKLSPDNTLGTTGSLIVADLDANGDLIPGSNATYSLGQVIPYGIELSPNGKYLYYTFENLNTGAGGINYFDLTTGVLNALPGAIQAQDFSHSQIELFYPGKKMYLAANNRFGYLSDANDPYSGFIEPDLNIPINSLNLAQGGAPLNSTINYGIYLMNDQVDGGYYFTDIESPPSCCSENISYDKFSYSASVSATWTNGNNPFSNKNGIIFIRDELRIPTGKSIIISGMNFHFGINGKIIIEKGAKLTINNSTLTSVGCHGVMWNGIEIQGTPGIAHSTAAVNSNYGVVVLNNSEISNAHYGISTTLRDINNNFIVPHSGGMVVATNSHFLNNYIDVDFAPLIAFSGIFPFTISLQSNKSVFTDCLFETTFAELKDNLKPYPLYHIGMVQVAGVRFYRNTFINQVNQQANQTDRGTGIYSVDSKFYATWKCNSNPPIGVPCPESDRQGNLFENLAYGIDASSAMPLMNPVIEYNDFIDNARGIRMVGIVGGSIAKNNFEIGTDVPDPSGMFTTYGIHTTNCTGYFIEDNYLTTHNNGKLGIVTVNSGQNNNQIRNNTFNNLDYSASASRINWGDNINGTYVGVQYLCNDFNNSHQVDVQVTSGGIHTGQGSCLAPSAPQNLRNMAPANNTFSPVVPPLLHFTLDATHVFHQTTYVFPATNSTPGIIEPANVSIFPYFESPCGTANYTDKQSVCPDLYATTTPNGVLITRMSTLKGEIDALLQLIDAGNTQGLLAAINSNMAPGQLKNLLMGASPYLSDEVLLALIQKTPSLPPGILKDILLANAPFSPEVFDAIQTLTLPKGIRSQITAAQKGTSARDELFADISSRMFEKDMDFDELFRRYQNDTIYSNPLDSLETLLLTDPTIEHELTRVSVKIMKGDFSGATALITNIRSITTDYENYLKLLESLMTIYQCQDKAFRLNWDLTLKQQMIDIATADDNKVECKNAGSILELLKIFSQPELFEYVNPSNARSMVFLSPDTEQEKSLTIWPNPADDILNIQLPVVEAQFDIRVYDATGRIILSTSNSNADYAKLNMNELPSGVYLLIISTRNGKQYFNKLIKN
ncbi:MAG: T9SS type A sorting domain-containing protein [Flavobacteriales bacterium]|nr:T9SS type A sorting domain-containing protein [Flavobacteriales bacterium]